MPTSNSRINRQNGVRGANASQRARTVSAAIRRATGIRPNGRDAVLFGVTCRQLGTDVVVRTGYIPGDNADSPYSEQSAETLSADLETTLGGLGYLVKRMGPMSIWVTGHPNWS